ncbi:hypothetical protein [Sediminicola luteus]|uniref:Uncharacterized protein n=1 Tax=Sediminicola luteus TaxID=319238 RepID=A0A2A4G6E3_9FLAO|nr:hypothetical protein [Sediminicola luteus]PCE64539.1 hypothetical protein B7P33_09660 [Sediminicola luteus]
MKFKLISAAFLLGGLCLNAQYAGGAIGQGYSQGNDAAINHYLGDISSGEAKKDGGLDLNNVQGSPYTNNNFAPGTVFYENENEGNVYFRYNAHNEEVEIKKSPLPTEAPRALARDKKLSIMIAGKPMSFKTFIDAKGKTQNGYLTLLTDGSKFDLYKRTKVKFTEAEAAQNSFVAAKPARFAQFTEYYIQKEGVNRIDEIKLKNKAVAKLVDNDKKAEIKAFIKENSLNIKEEADLVKIVEFLNK